MLCLSKSTLSNILLYPLLDIGSWARYITTLFLGFLIYKKGYWYYLLHQIFTSVKLYLPLYLYFYYKKNNLSQCWRFIGTFPSIRIYQSLISSLSQSLLESLALHLWPTNNKSKVIIMSLAYIFQLYFCSQLFSFLLCPYF